MKKFLAHIEYLLTEQSHVIVPELGVFICENKSAEILEDGSIKAPSREIRFNSQLTHDDETLALSVAEIESISPEEAHSYVAKMVQELIWTLSIETEVPVGQCGKLIVENNQIQFIESSRGMSLFNNFGMKMLNIKPVTIKEEVADVPVISESKEKIHISINKRTLRHVASVAAAILIFFLFSAPVTQHNTHLNYASIVSSEIFMQKQKALLAELPGEIAEPFDALNTSAEILPEPVAETQPIQEVVKTPEPAPAPAAVTPAAKDRYYIIVNSFPNKRETDYYLKKLHKDGYSSAALLENGSRTRIYLKSFPAGHKDQAQEELNELRKNKQFADAWIYSLKN
ncbi:MAG: SPOR domain-containing protein [Bacteroidales bacterium]